jgi:hypothetical protein
MTTGTQVGEIRPPRRPVAGCLVGSQSVVGVAEQVDFDGKGVAVADGGAVAMMLLFIVNTLVRIMQSKFG